MPRMGNPALLRAIANPTPYPGAHPNPTTAAPDHNRDPQAPPEHGDPEADKNGDHPLAEITKRTTEIKAQADELAKNVGYLLSDATLHDEVPARVEAKLKKAMAALTDAVDSIGGTGEDLQGQIDKDTQAKDQPTDDASETDDEDA
jgi:hypothetical protein